jgi:hypothetical protein
MNVSSVAHTLCALQKKHSSPIQSQSYKHTPTIKSFSLNLQYNLVSKIRVKSTKELLLSGVRILFLFVDCSRKSKSKSVT